MKLFIDKLKNHIYWLKISSGLYDGMDDETFLKMAYKRKFGKELDLNNPVTFNEKLQWLKLNDRKPEYTEMVDKFMAKKYVASIIGQEHIIPTQFVLKCTHDSGGLVVCKDKSNLNKKAAKKKIEKSMKTNYYKGGREWPYKNVKPQIIAEEYMEDI